MIVATKVNNFSVTLHLNWYINSPKECLMIKSWLTVIIIKCNIKFVLIQCCLSEEEFYKLLSSLNDTKCCKDLIP